MRSRRGDSVCGQHWRKRYVALRYMLRLVACLVNQSVPVGVADQIICFHNLSMRWLGGV
jgi:hypothetical protein